MKTLNPVFLVLCLLTFFNFTCKSQFVSENFNAGFPVSWTQNPAGTWSLSPNLGISGSGCAESYELGTNTVIASLNTPVLNLNSVSNLTITFRAAVIGNNFIVPNVVLSYDPGSGPQFLARWGSGFTPNTTYTITGGYDYQPPLDSIHIQWQNCTYTLASVSGTMTAFLFAAEFVNGGYVVIDNIVISGFVPITTEIIENSHNDLITVFPNPTINKIITLKNCSLKNILITDNLGRTVPANLLNTNDVLKIDLSNFASGVYYLTAFNSDDVLIREKIVVE